MLRHVSTTIEGLGRPSSLNSLVGVIAYATYIQELILKNNAIVTLNSLVGVIAYATEMGAVAVVAAATTTLNSLVGVIAYATYRSI